METVRTFANNNRGLIINAVYIIAFLVILYLIYYYLTAGDELQIDILMDVMPANKPSPRVGKDGLPPLNNINPNVRILAGGEYTLSFWMYINGWDYRSGLPKSVLQVTDSEIPTAFLLNTILYPNEAKLMVRVHTENPRGQDITDVATSNTVISGGSGFLKGGTTNSPVCDIQEIDLQRWINILVAVNGRIIDVYYDGKLSRSCVLPDFPVAGSPSSTQIVKFGDNGGFSGQMSGIQFFAYALTPDRIYAIYQRGPSGGNNIVKNLFARLGIRVGYTGSSPVGQFL